jgi:hypothetical protein
MGVFDQTPRTKYTALMTRSLNLLTAQADVATQGWAFVWANPDHLTPQQACDIIQSEALLAGTNTAAVFQAHAETIAYLNLVKPGSVNAKCTAIPSTYTVSYDPTTGAATVTAVPAPAPAPAA